MSNTNETCRRCGAETSECRSLTVSCFYDLSWLELPLELIEIKGQPRVCVGEEEVDYGADGIRLKKIFAEHPDWVEREYRFYTVRICKDCRADGLRAFKFWFEHPLPEDSAPILEEGAIYERDFGSPQKRDVLNEETLDE